MPVVLEVVPNAPEVMGKRGREGERERGREGGREGGREEEREGPGREGGRGGDCCSLHQQMRYFKFTHLVSSVLVQASSDNSNSSEGCIIVSVRNVSVSV